MPPIFTNSAVTPAVFIELIFSTKAGGNVSSIPKRIPIFLFAIISVLNLAPLEILPGHPLPQWPVMLAVVPVDIQPMRNSLAMQNRRHLHVRVQAHIPVRRSQHNPHLRSEEHTSELQ